MGHHFHDSYLRAENRKQIPEFQAQSARPDDDHLFGDFHQVERFVTGKDFPAIDMERGDHCRLAAGSNDNIFRRDSRNAVAVCDFNRMIIDQPCFSRDPGNTSRFDQHIIQSEF
ncbi:hypothetical protein SDC9_162024 [bioreactor metagenome]|uniref:Uncharacterized protein n=1 Tax=bioreactor metagenome TaxID=1076179 RepID=A0A645FJX1_9ZZZZ